jgi:hypothetical protein
LVVLAFDLQFGLQFFHEQIEVGDLHAEFLDVGWRGCGTLRRRRLLRKRRLAWICGQTWLLGVWCLLARGEGFGEGARPGGLSGFGLLGRLGRGLL